MTVTNDEYVSAAEMKRRRATALNVESTSKEDHILYPDILTPDEHAEAAAADAKRQNTKYDKLFPMEGIMPWDGAYAVRYVARNKYGVEGFGLQTGGGFSPPSNPQETIIDINIKVYNDEDGVEFVEEDLKDRKITSMAMLVDIAEAHGVSVPRVPTEQHRSDIVSQLAKQFTLVDVREGRVTVPWGVVEIPGLGVLTLDGSEKNGKPYFILQIAATHAKSAECDEFVELIREEVKKNSIYRGFFLKSVTGMPKFGNPFKVREANLVFNKVLQYQLNKICKKFQWIDDYIMNGETRLGSRTLQRLGDQFLFFGLWGTGKTEASMVIMQYCMMNGVTGFRMSLTSGDTIDLMLAIAEDFQPAALIIEDLDIFLVNATVEERSKMLERLNNKSSTGTEITMIFTTNYPDMFDEGTLRRVKEVEFISMDMEAIERLYKQRITNLAPNIDWARVEKSVTNRDKLIFTSSFIIDVIGEVDDDKLGNENRVVTTEDLELAGGSQEARFTRFINKRKQTNAEPTMESVLIPKIVQQIKMEMNDIVLTNKQIGSITVDQ